MVKTQVCGITSYQDAAMALDYGVDALGFIFDSRHPAHIAPADAREIVNRLPPLVPIFGVFTNEFSFDVVQTIAETVKLTTLQLNGNESPEYCANLSRWRLVKTLRVSETFELGHIRDFPVQAVLLTGYSEDSAERLFDWRYAVAAKQQNHVILSGGLTPDNVAAAIRTVKPYAIDVCQGVEDAPGRKDRGKLHLFMQEVERGRQEILKSTTGRLTRIVDL